jgi:transmembrane sensor
MNVTHKDDSYKQSSRVTCLIEGFIKGRLTTAEHDELDAWVEASDDNMRLFEELTDDKKVHASPKVLKHVGDRRLSPFFKKLAIFKRETWKAERVYIGLIVLFFVSLLSLQLFFYIAERQPPNAVGEILPSRHTTTLVLGNGSIVDVTTSKDGLIASENGTRVKKTNGEALLYDHTLPTSQPLSYNTLSTGKGSQYSVVLPDGSKVWLNAQSSLRYPTRFSASGREVELNGEAYFEVAPNADGNQQPFVVKLRNNGSIECLAARFNVSSYEDESNARVTLLNGSAEMWRQHEKLELHAGQEGRFSQSLQMADSVDVQQTLAWKNGEFIFRDADMETVMREVERWYDVQGTGASTITARFNVTASRKEPLSKLLDALEATGKVRFKIRGRQISVIH